MVKMRSLSTDLSLGAQTSYAELSDIAGGVEKTRFGTLRGSFHRRQINGNTYVYFNYRDFDGCGCSVYVGPESARVQGLVSEFERSLVAESLIALSRRAQACLALGCGGLPTKHFRTIQKLVGYGFFRGGGVLVGTHAFVTMGDMLGVRWAGGGNAMCVDLARTESCISIALPMEFEDRTHDAITSLEAGLLPIREFSRRASAHRRDDKAPELGIQFIIPNDEGNRASQVSNLTIDLEPRKFTDLLLEDLSHGVVFAKSGACRVNVPDPARFAVHNIVVYGHGSIPERLTLIGLLDQAAALIEWHMDQQRITQFRAVWQDVLARGPAWRESADQGSLRLVGAASCPGGELRMITPERRWSETRFTAQSNARGDCSPPADLDCDFNPAAAPCLNMISDLLT